MRERRFTYTAVTIVVLTVMVLFGVWYVFEKKHLTYLEKDLRTGLNLSSYCKYGGRSFRTYVKVEYGGRDDIIQLNEIPYSADMLADCTKEPFYVVKKIVVDPDFKHLTVTFLSDKRSQLKIPLALEGLDLIFHPSSDTKELN